MPSGARTMILENEVGLRHSSLKAILDPIEYPSSSVFFRDPNNSRALSLGP